MDLPDFSTLIGRRIAEIQLVAPTSWWFRFSSGGALRADTLWRLIYRGRIHTTSNDHGHLFGRAERLDSADEALKAIGGSNVKAVKLISATGDLWIEFDDDSRLETLTTSGGYEGWALFLPSGSEIIGLGGGSVQVRKREQ